MSLPELEWQWVYSRLAWGAVFASLVLRTWPGSAARPPRAAWVAAGAVVAAMLLPHAASPAYWLGLMFQYPSVMLVACLIVPLLAGDSLPLSAPIPGPRLALMLALGGAWLYADASGWLNTGLYAQGFDRRWAPAAALLIGAGAVWAVRGATTRASGLVVLACVGVFCLTRLPTGNLFDALLDPLMWCWALVASVTAALRRVRRARQAPRPAPPTPAA